LCFTAFRKLKIPMAPAGELLRRAQTRLIGEGAPFQAPEAALLATQLLFRP